MSAAPICCASDDNLTSRLISTRGEDRTGSTAKLRTLVTYLEIIAELHERYAGLPRENLRRLMLTEVIRPGGLWITCRLEKIRLLPQCWKRPWIVVTPRARENPFLQVE
jgi:hypothetical protein